MKTAVSLFAGVGGFDLALERNGYKVVSAAEIDKHAHGILSQRFPHSHIYDDVRKVSGDGLRADGFISEGGIITGGFPCQDLSVAGKRAGLAGARSGLFYEIARIADESKAEWLVLENVPGLLSSQRGADMGAVVGTLVDLGYGVAWRVLDAQHFGVPQRRRRVFIVARRAGDPTSAAKVLFERQSLRGDSSTSRKTRQETAGAVGDSSEVAGALTAAGIRCDLNKAVSGHLTVDEPVLAFSSGQSAKAYGLAIDENVAPPLRASGGNNSKPTIVEPTLYEPHHGDGRAVQGRANTLNARMGTGGNNLPVLIETETYVKAKRAQSATDDESWREDTVTPTLNQFDTGDTRATVVAIEPTTGNGGDVMNTIPASIYHHGTMVNQDVNNGLMVLTQTVRRLTPLECERLQGFPDGWTEGQADSHRYKQMGNAVAVPVVEWVIRGIVEAG